MLPTLSVPLKCISYTPRQSMSQSPLSCAMLAQFTLLYGLKYESQLDFLYLR